MKTQIDDDLNLTSNHFGDKFFRGEPNNLLEASSARLNDRKVMVGLGFGKAGVPIDVLTLLLAASTCDKLQVLVVDEFAAMNGQPEAEVTAQSSRLLDALGRIQAVYNLPLNTTRCSDFMHTKAYRDCFHQVKQIVEQTGLERELFLSVPERYRTNATALLYPLHEIAVTLYMQSTMGVEVKLGPNKERIYDRTMCALGIPIEFAYAVDALPLATREPSQVIHYIPNHVAKGRRIMLGDSPEHVYQLLEKSHEQTLRYLARVASAAARCLWRRPFCPSIN